MTKVLEWILSAAQIKRVLGLPYYVATNRGVTPSSALEGCAPGLSLELFMTILNESGKIDRRRRLEESVESIIFRSDGSFEVLDSESEPVNVSETEQVSISLLDLQGRIRAFAVERDWEQFHLPRSLVLALVGEVGELAAELQWISDDQISDHLSDDLRNRLSSELADILSYTLRLADVLSIDLTSALIEKIEINESRYPASRARGSAEKYTAYE